MIYVVKSQSFLRTPLVSILMEGEDWLVGFDETFDDMSNDSLIEFEGFNNYPAARIRAYDRSHFAIELDLEGCAQHQPHRRRQELVHQPDGSRGILGAIHPLDHNQALRQRPGNAGAVSPRQEQRPGAQHRGRREGAAA